MPSWSNRFARRPELAPEALALLGLPNARGVLAHAPLMDGGWAAATTSGLKVAARGRLVDRPWVQVDHAVWDDDSRTLAIWWVGSRQPTPLELGETPGHLPQVVHERVRSSIVVAREVTLEAGRKVRVAVRKSADGELTLQVVPGVGVKLTDPAVAALVDPVVADLREQVGLTGASTTWPVS